MRVAKLDNVNLHWREDGDPTGASVVFANSLGTDLRLWDNVVTQMPANLRLIRFDMRGHGLSDCPPEPYSMADLVADTEQFLDKIHVKSCVFVGLSIGGMIAQSLAHKRPDLIRAVVLSNTAAVMGDPALWQERIDAVRSGGVASIADQTMERWFSDKFLKSDEFAAWRNMLIRTPDQGYIGCSHAIARADLTQVTATLQLPALGISGSEDRASPSPLVATTVAQIKGSNFVEINGVGHLPCVEAPTKFTQLIEKFIKDLEHD